jgi:DNA-directed RNA polymerase subunit RPC12/RpoP
MPHRCDQCKQPIETASGAWASTRVCPHENCGRVTSLYAVLYRCLACGQPLETPRRMDDQETAGSETVCPKCTQPVRVPFGALEREDGRPGTPDEYGFRCVHCRQGIRVHRTQARRLGVCPHCHKPVEVPPGGYGLGAMAAPRTGDAREVLDEVTVHCPRCRAEMPKAAVSCPFCGHTGS